MRWTAALLLVAFVAGCTAPSALHGPDQPVDASRDLQDPAAIVAGSGEPLATVSFVAASHNEWADEEHRDEAPYPVTLHYYGIQTVIDGYGRERPAVVYSINATRPAADADAKDEDAVAGAVDDRLVLALAPQTWGLVSMSLDGHALSGAWFLHADEFILPATGPLSFLLVHAAGGDLTQEVLAYDNADGQVFVSLTATDERPLPGDCEPYLLGGRVVAKATEHDTASTGSASEAPKISEPHRSLICIEQGSRTPLWNWSGNSTRWDSLERRSAGIEPPARRGEALGPVEYALEPWAEVGGLDGGLLVGATLAPPSDGVDWAALIHAQAASLYRGRGYAEFVAANGQPAVQSSTQFPDSQVAASLGMQQSIVSVGGTDSSWTAIVTEAREGATGQSLRFSDGWSSGAETPLSSEQMPTAGDLQRHLAPLLDGETAVLAFGAFPDPFLASEGGFWMRLAACGETGGSLQIIDAQHGLMRFSFVFADACSAVANSSLVEQGVAFEREWMTQLPALESHLTQIRRFSTPL